MGGIKQKKYIIHRWASRLFLLFHSSNFAANNKTGANIGYHQKGQACWKKKSGTYFVLYVITKILKMICFMCVVVINCQSSQAKSAPIDSVNESITFKNESLRGCRNQY